MQARTALLKPPPGRGEAECEAGMQAVIRLGMPAPVTMVANGTLKVTRDAQTVGALSSGGPIRLRRPAR